MNPRRASLLREMGLAPLWRLRSASASAPTLIPDETAIPPTDVAPAPSAVHAALATDTNATARPAPAARTAREAMPPVAHLATPRRTPQPEPVPQPLPHLAQDVPVADAARAARIATLDWDALEADIRTCTACVLCKRRKQAVPGVGDRQAEWMLVGEGPGAEEDQRGEPFVGAAGKLLDAMLAAIGRRRGGGVYIANAVKCRPPLNRTPQADEIAACYPYLKRQIELVRPRLLVALGRPAAQALLKSEVSIAAARGKVFHYGDIPLVITYHPAYLLRNQPDKAKAWEDLCFARRLMAP